MSSKRWGNGARVDDVKTGKKLILQAAIKCFITKGMKATTIEDVADAANVTRRTVYRYYAGKQDLIAAVIHQERTRMFDQLEEALTPFTGDFPRIIEECIVFTTLYRPPEEEKSDLVTGANASEAKPHLETPDSALEWQRVMTPHYEAYCETHPNVGSLEELTHFIGHLVLAYREVPYSEEQLRRSIRAFQSMSRP